MTADEILDSFLDGPQDAEHRWDTLVDLYPQIRVHLITHAGNNRHEQLIIQLFDVIHAKTVADNELIRKLR